MGRSRRGNCRRLSLEIRCEKTIRTRGKHQPFVSDESAKYSGEFVIPIDKYLSLCCSFWEGRNSGSSFQRRLLAVPLHRLELAQDRAQTALLGTLARSPVTRSSRLLSCLFFVAKPHCYKNIDPTSPCKYLQFTIHHLTRLNPKPKNFRQQGHSFPLLPW